MKPLYPGNESNMISSDTANKQASINLDKKTTAELIDIETCIKNAIRVGKFSCYYSKKISNDSLVKLKALGYKVKENYSSDPRDTFSGTNYKISW